MKYFNLLSIITACAALVPMYGCGDSDLKYADISDNSVFHALENTTWVCPLNLYVEEIYFSPVADGATYTRTSYLTGGKHINYGMVMSDNTVVNGVHYLTDAEGAKDNKFVVKSLSENTLKCIWDGANVDSKEMEYCRVKHTVCSKVGKELSTADLGLTEPASCILNPGMLFYINGDKVITTGEGVGYLFVTPKNGGEEYAIKIITQTPFYKQTDMVIYPYENLLTMSFDRAHNFLVPAEYEGDDGIHIYKRNYSSDPSFIDMVELISNDDEAIVDAILLRLNKSCDMSELIRMFDSLLISSQKFEYDKYVMYVLTNRFGVPYYLSVEFDEHTVTYMVREEEKPVDFFDKGGFENDRFLN